MQEKKLQQNRHQKKIMLQYFLTIEKRRHEMKTGSLLEELINIAQVSKTDFALSMNMTPSGLSKILKAGRVLLFKEKKVFSRQAAAYFANSLYSHCCYLKLMNVFPVIYDFNSRYELETFLSFAIEYALDIDLEEENKGNLIYSESELCFLGQKNILNFFCILTSHYLTASNNGSFEFYGTLPFLDRCYTNIFSRIKLISCDQSKNKLIYNHFINIGAMEKSTSRYDIGFLSSIVHSQTYIDLFFWNITEEINSPFLLLKDNFLLNFSTQLDGTPLMTYISQKSHISSSLNSLLQKEVKKISYGREDALLALQNNPDLLDKLISKNIYSVYNGIPIGYLLHEQELKNDHCSDNVKDFILGLFQEILSHDSEFFITVNSMMNFCATGKVIVPLWGEITLPAKERYSYLQRLEPIISNGKIDKFKIVNNDLFEMSVVCAPGISLIYTISHDRTSEKIHYFETELISSIFKKQIEKKQIHVIELTTDIWKSYLDEMSNNFFIHSK